MKGLSDVAHGIARADLICVTYVHSGHDLSGAPTGDLATDQIVGWSMSH